MSARSWTAPALWRFRRRTAVQKAPEGWRSPGRFATPTDLRGSAIRASVEHLSAIQNPVRVQHAPQLAHHAHLGVAGELREERFLRDADAVFAGDRAAETDGFAENFFERFLHAVHFVGV